MAAPLCADGRTDALHRRASVSNVALTLRHWFTLELISNLNSASDFNLCASNGLTLGRADSEPLCSGLDRSDKENLF